MSGEVGAPFAFGAASSWHAHFAGNGIGGQLTSWGPPRNQSCQFSVIVKIRELGAGEFPFFRDRSLLPRSPSLSRTI